MHSRNRTLRFALAAALAFLPALAPAGDADPAATPAPAAAPAPTPTPAPPIQQVRVEVRVLEWHLQNNLDYDFAVLFRGEPGSIVGTGDLTLPASPPLTSAARVFLSGMDTGHGTFDAVIEALAVAGTVKILHQPTLIVTVGPAPADPAVFDGKVTSGSRIPYEAAKAFGGTKIASTTEYRQAGVSFECNATEIKYDEFVKLDIKASVTDLTGFISIGLNDQNNPMRVPVLDRREINNKILARDRSILISGLLKSNREVERRQGIPWLSELPGFRSVLSNVSKEDSVSELVFLVRPEILDPVAPAPGAIQ